jgi:anti-sigma regulatory factor (Ser/Thr protein kinase)
MDSTQTVRPDEFRHEAFLYASDAEFLSGTASFITEGLAAGASTLVVVDADKIAELRRILGRDADAVEFADMAAVGRNPARIIPVWRDFVDRHAADGAPLRGIGEPIWVGRDPDELVECRHHEALLNLAFADAPAFWLLCPYDVSALQDAVLRSARGTHPFVCTTGHGRASPGYGRTDPGELLAEPLTAPPAQRATLPFTELCAVRGFLAAHAPALGLDAPAEDDVTLAVNEVAANSLRHGGGSGTMSVWRRNGSLVCQIDDGGHVSDPLAGRRRPSSTQLGGRGLWIANQACRLLQLRTSPAGTTVRLHFAL